MIPGTLLVVVVALALAALSGVAEAFKGKCGQQQTNNDNDTSLIRHRSHRRIRLIPWLRLL